MLKQAIYLFLISSAFGLGINLVSPNKIDVVGDYRELLTGEGPIVPPSAQEGDPPFIDISVAQMEFTAKTSLFVDARDTAEFNCGTIPGSIHIPFDYLPEGDLGVHFDSTLAQVSKERLMIVFCSGEECDLSLHLARNLQQEGYTGVSIFFGGAREWAKVGLTLEKRAECVE
ncbi:MAG: rhodanese-like domain-containing protein [candidate division Zixibacteria bacterium]|nr:rhodanese-like domain-containing protein [candidate division Zixibacteria bacterium]